MGPGHQCFLRLTNGERLLASDTIQLYFDLGDPSHCRASHAWQERTGIVSRIEVWFRLGEIERGSDGIVRLPCRIRRTNPGNH